MLREVLVLQLYLCLQDTRFRVTRSHSHLCFRSPGIIFSSFLRWHRRTTFRLIPSLELDTLKKCKDICLARLVLWPYLTALRYQRLFHP